MLPDTAKADLTATCTNGGINVSRSSSTLAVHRTVDGTTLRRAA